jgi:hypothetical protein
LQGLVDAIGQSPCPQGKHGAVTPILSAELGIIGQIRRIYAKAKDKYERQTGQHQQVVHPFRVADLGTVDVEPPGFQVAEQGLNLEALFVVVAGEVRQFQARDQENRVFVLRTVPRHGVDWAEALGGEVCAGQKKCRCPFAGDSRPKGNSSPSSCRMASLGVRSTYSHPSSRQRACRPQPSNSPSPSSTLRQPDGRISEAISNRATCIS